MKPLRVLLVAAAVLAVGTLMFATSAFASGGGWHSQKALFVQTNNLGANRIIVYDRAWDGTLSRVTSYLPAAKAAWRPVRPQTRWPRRVRWPAPIMGVCFWRSTPAATRSRCSGCTVTQLVGRALRARGLTNDGLMPFVEEFLALYRENLTTNTKIYDGGRELLEQLCREGRRVGICTNKNHELTIEILRQLDLIKYFGSVLGERVGHPCKPDPAPLLKVLSELNVSPSRALMVGDSEADVACARAAKFPVVVVNFGYSRVAPDALGADAVISRLSELHTVLASVAR